MKVLILSKSFEREIRELTTFLSEKVPHIQTHVVMPPSETGSWPVPASFHKTHWSQHIRAAWFSPLLLPEFAAFRPDIVQVFEEYSGLMAFQALLLKNVHCPHSKFMVYSAENILHNVHPLFSLPARYVMRHADLAFVCSHGVKEVLASEGFRQPIDVFPLGVDTEAFRKCDASALKHDLGLDGMFIIGYVGRLLAIKGIFDLPELLRELPEYVYLLMVGGGPEEAAFRRRVAEYRLTDRVHILGDIPYAELPRYMNCMDVGIVPSLTTPRWKEQFGRVLIEFMSCEVPVVGTESGAIPEVLGETGWLFQEKNIQQLQHIIIEHLKQPGMLPAMGKRGRERVLKNYSLHVMNTQILACYQRLSPCL